MSLPEKKIVSRRIQSILINIIFLGIGLGIVYVLVKNDNWSAIKENIFLTNYHWLIWPKILMILAHLIRARRWQIMLEPTGYKPKLTNAFNALLLSYAASLIVSRASDLVRSLYIKKTDKISMDITVGNIVMERVIDLISLGCITLLTFFLNPKLYGSFIQTQLVEALSTKLSSLPTFSTLAIILFILLTMTFITIRIVKKNTLNKILTNFKKGIFSIQKLKKKSEFILLTIVMWVLYWSNIQLGFKALEATSNLIWEDGVFIQVMSGIAIASPTQAGMGVFHWTVSKALETLSVSPSAAISWAFIFFAVSFIFKLVCGIFSYIHLLIHTRK